MWPPPKSPDRQDSKAYRNSEFSEDEQRLLLAVAHASIATSFDHRAIDLTAPSPLLEQPRGVFTTLYLHGSLRGCVGYVLPTVPVYRAVAETAWAAAFDDTRFTPVSQAEAPELEISLSVLSPLRDTSWDQVEVGRHGLLISQQGRRGLLLPQVPVEHGWDRLAFLEHTCGKAGLPPDAWKHGARIECFTAEVFGDAKM